MPQILSLKPDTVSRIVVWKIEEDEDFFLQSLPLAANDRSGLDRITGKSRRLEWLAVRWLLHQHTGLCRVEYSLSGKPNLPGSNTQLSVSHSKGMVALIFGSKQNYAIDIESANPKLISLAPRFLNNDELTRAGSLDDPLPFFQSAWCAKECLIKWFGDRTIDFRNQMTIWPDSSNSALLMASCTYKNQEHSFRLNSIDIHDYKMIWMASND